MSNRAALRYLTNAVESGSGRVESKRRQFELPAAWQTARRYWQLLLVAAALLMLFVPVIAGLFVHWYQDPDYSRAFFVPFLAAYLVRRKWDQLLKLPARPSWYGLFVVAGSLGLLFLGSLGAELFLT